MPHAGKGSLCSVVDRQSVSTTREHECGKPAGIGEIALLFGFHLLFFHSWPLLSEWTLNLFLRYNSWCRGKKHCFSFRPGCCAKHGLAEAYKTSIDFPDETLSFIKSHPLMDSAVPPIAEEPWFTKTRIRWGWGERVTHCHPVPSLPVGLTHWLGSPHLAGTDWRPSLLTILPDPTRTTLSSLLAQKLAWYLKFWQRPVLSLWMTAYYWKRLKHTTMQSRYILRECSSALLKNFWILFHLVISFQLSKLAVVWHISVLGFFFFFSLK